MKTAKLVIGIISMVLFFVILFQSCAAAVGGALFAPNDTSGSSGAVLALCMLIAGIIGVAGRNSKGASITAGVFYAVGGLIGFANIGIFLDMIIWSSLALLFGAVFIFGTITAAPEASVSYDLFDGSDEPLHNITGMDRIITVYDDRIDIRRKENKAVETRIPLSRLIAYIPDEAAVTIRHIRDGEESTITVAMPRSKWELSQKIAATVSKLQARAAEF